MKISVGMLVVNGRPFIKAQLENLYDVAHEIVISEGGDQFWRERHGFTRSNDGTIDIIKNFPDPKNKIKLIQREWKNKNEMSHAYSKGMTGDIIYNVDLDEFIHPKQLISVCKNLMKSKKKSSATIPNYVFFGDFNTLMVMEHTDTWFQTPRIFKRSPNHLMHHLPPAYWKNGIVGAAPLPASENPGVFIHHYSWIYKKSVHDKIGYYNYRIKGCIKPGFLKMFDSFDVERENLIKTRTNIRPTQGKKQFLKPYKGKQLGLVVQNIKNEIALLESQG